MSNIIQTLTEYNSKSPRENILKKQFIQFLESSGKSAYSRENLSGHLTASAWVLDAETQSETLLVKHKRLGRWLQPGGHVDGEENLARVAEKELFEETGIGSTPVTYQLFDIDVHPIPWSGTIPPHLHFDVRFLFLVSSKIPLVCSSESDDVKWFSLKDLSNLDTDESVRLMAQKSITNI